MSACRPDIQGHKGAHGERFFVLRCVSECSLCVITVILTGRPRSQFRCELRGLLRWKRLGAATQGPRTGEERKAMETSRRQFPVPEFSHKVRSRLLAPPPSGWWAGELGSIRR
ncbi:hypothetical protein B0T13DRAFT_475623 [Neurospora crassa]|nr:hypothetical protein B0T13DRAFT_475623 [Neurospora crassa]